MMRPDHRLITGLALSTLVLTAFGCGDGLKVRYPVYGKVTYKGQPVPTGTVTFAPSTTRAREPSARSPKAPIR